MPFCVPSTDHMDHPPAPSRAIHQPPLLLLAAFCTVQGRAACAPSPGAAPLPNWGWMGGQHRRTDRQKGAHAWGLRVGRAMSTKTSEIWVCSWWVWVLVADSCLHHVLAPSGNIELELYFQETQMSPQPGGFTLCCLTPWRGAHSPL